MTSSCPDLVPPFVVINNVLTSNSTLQVSTTQTSVGKEVKLSCKFNYTLVAESPTVKCLSNGNWNFTTSPKCEPPPLSTGLSEDQKIILYVAGGVAGLVLILLAIMICLICRAKKKKNEKKGLPRTNSSGTPHLPDDYMGPPMDAYPQFDYPYDVDPYQQDRKGFIVPPVRHSHIDNPAFTREREPDYSESERRHGGEIDRRAEQSFRKYALQSRDVTPRSLDREYFGDPPRDPRSPRRFPSQNGNPTYTNSVRMFEEYGRPQKVEVLEEAYEMRRDNRSPSSTYNYITRGLVTKPYDSYRSKGEDPTRLYR